MILFMEYSSGGKTGGQYEQARLFSFLKKRFAETLPEERELAPSEIAHPLKHALHSLSRVKRHLPDLIVLSSYASCRNILAVRFMKKKNRNIMALHLGLRMAFRKNNLLSRIIFRWCERYLFRNADIIQVCSDFLADKARQEASKDTYVYVARPGLQVEPEKVIEIPGALEQSDIPINLLYVGECQMIKGTKYLVEAMVHLKDLNIRLDIVGKYIAKSPYVKELQRIIYRGSIADRIEFYGALEPIQLKTLYEKASIYVMPSLKEGYGMSLAEAICFGLPVVASRTGAIPELVEDGINGILVSPGNSVELASAVRKLATDVELRMAMRKANLEKAKTLSRWDDYERILDTLLVPLIEKLTGLRARGDRIVS